MEQRIKDNRKKQRNFGIGMLNVLLFLVSYLILLTVIASTESEELGVEFMRTILGIWDWMKFFPPLWVVFFAGICIIVITIVDLIKRFIVRTKGVYNITQSEEVYAGNVFLYLLEIVNIATLIIGIVYLIFVGNPQYKKYKEVDKISWDNYNKEWDRKQSSLRKFKCEIVITNDFGVDLFEAESANDLGDVSTTINYLRQVNHKLNNQKDSLEKIDSPSIEWADAIENKIEYISAIIQNNSELIKAIYQYDTEMRKGIISGIIKNLQNSQKIINSSFTNLDCEVSAQEERENLEPPCKKSYCD